MIRGRTTRRELLRAGGRALAGLAFAGVWPAGRLHTLPPGPRRDPAEILMRADVLGSRVWFDPVGLLVVPGQTIRWVVERHAHTATAYHPDNDGSPRRIPARAAPWDSGYLLNPGDAFEISLTAEGVYDYYCRPHEAAGMVGRIVVSREPERSFPALGWDAATGRDVPEAARRAFPSVERILAEGIVRTEGDARDP